MNKIYLIYGDEKYFIDNEISKLKNQYKDYDLITYDMLISNISEALEDISTISLFSLNKMVICDNCYFLTGLKCDIDHKTDDLIKYINYDSNSVLILVVNSDLDNRKKVVKELSKCNVIKCSKLKSFELSNFVKNYCKENNFRIDNEAILLFLSKLTEDLYIITSELDKLFIYKNNNIITKEDVELVTSRVINTNIFDLVNAIVKKDVDLSLELYDDLILVNEEEIKLIVTLANQFRLIYQVKMMFKMGYTELDISKKLDVHPYRIKLARNVDISLSDALIYLKKLSVLDENIKSGVVDKKIGFEKFILSL